MKRRPILLLGAGLAICIAVFLSWSHFDGQPKQGEKAEQYVANEQQLQILNSLQGKTISYGELIRSVYPESVSGIPQDVLKNMDQTQITVSGNTGEGSLYGINIAVANANRSLLYIVLAVFILSTGIMVYIRLSRRSLRV